MPKDVVLCDLDGVLTDFGGAVCAKLGVPDPYLDPKHWGNFNALSDLYPQLWNELDYEFWANLPLTEEAKELVSYLEKEFGEEQVAFCTAPVRHDGCMPGKKAWVLQHFPRFAKKLIMTTTKYFLAHDRAWLVDDKDENCSDFFKYGGHPVLFPRLWNTFGTEPYLKVRDGVVTGPAKDPLTYVKRHIDTRRTWRQS